VKREVGTTWTLEEGWVMRQDLYEDYDAALAALRSD
jgi:hypothetical protein